MEELEEFRIRLLGHSVCVIAQTVERGPKQWVLSFLLKPTETQQIAIQKLKKIDKYVKSAISKEINKIQYSSTNPTISNKIKRCIYNLAQLCTIMIHLVTYKLRLRSSKSSGLR